MFVSVDKWQSAASMYHEEGVAEVATVVATVGVDVE